MKPLKYKNSLLKMYFSLIVEYGMYVIRIPQVSSETSLPCRFKTSPALQSVENEVESLERQCHSEKLSFVHKKETEHYF